MDDAERDLLRRFGAERFGLSLDDDSLGRIGRFVDLLEVWNRRIRLTGERDDALLVRKHVADSLAAVTLVRTSAGPVLDLGSGAGFPGMVLACIRPEVPVTLLDSRQKATSFLAEAIRVTGLPNARALCGRAEDASSDPEIAGRQAVVVSRAVRMETVLSLALPLRAPGGIVASMQTPNVTRGDAETAGRAHGLEVVGVLDYGLPTGEARRLISWR